MNTTEQKKNYTPLNPQNSLISSLISLEPFKAVKLLRDMMGLTQAQFALKIGVSESLVTQVETGGRPLTLSFLDKAKESLDIPDVLYLVIKNNMDKDSDPRHVSNHVDKIVNKIQSKYIENLTQSGNRLYCITAEVKGEGQDSVFKYKIVQTCSLNCYDLFRGQWPNLRPMTMIISFFDSLSDAERTLRHLKANYSKWSLSDEDGEYDV